MTSSRTDLFKVPCIWNTKCSIYLEVGYSKADFFGPSGLAGEEKGYFLPDLAMASVFGGGVKKWLKSPVHLVLVGALILSLGREMELTRRHHFMAEAFHYDLEVVVRDAASGAYLTELTFQHPDSNFGDAEVPEFMLRTSASSGGKDDVSFSIEGFARGETSFRVSCKGFASVEVPLNENTGSLVEVMLEPVSD